MQATRDIKRRIKSIQSTHKITRAMEMVSAAKMRKAVNRVMSTRAYADLTWQTVLHLARKVDTRQHPFFRETEVVKKIAIIIISTNRGLCGGFNTQLISKVRRAMTVHEQTLAMTDFISLGSKGRNEARRRGLNIVADFIKDDITVDSLVLRPVVKMITEGFVSGQYDRVLVAYTDFESTLSQKPHLKQLLPFAANIDERLGHIAHREPLDTVRIEEQVDFILEPSVREVFDSFLPRLLEVQLLQSVLESEASEHSARMMTMRNASESASEMMEELTLIYNQARQAGITAEIAEISAGAAAMAD
ncbi:MAG: ATP synthase F1 subunit gamma [Candidatus Komeilibacteria bacterium]|nr:ATP synthase F1 subunit gamma [Candidatus Komeilibacteria bacterium]